jgi:hypothetical protein
MEPTSTARLPLTPRSRFGQGATAASRAHSVFINCPYDAPFQPLFDAIVFAAICCGFLPRVAIESGDSSVLRMSRIADALAASRYSIHDLSRSKGEGPENLARFNMPIELGIAMGLELAGSDHQWVAIVPGHSYDRFASDLGGFDLNRHDETPEGVILAVMQWLVTRPDAEAAPTPVQVVDGLGEFDSRLAILRDSWAGKPPWVDIVQAGITVATSRWESWSLS